MYDSLRVLAAGEGAITAEFSDHVEPVANEAVRRLDQLLRTDAAASQDGRTWLLGTVPTYRSLLVVFDPLRVDRDELVPMLERLAAVALSALGGEADLPPGREVTIPVCYEPELAPDLAEIVELTGLQPAEVAALHTDGEYLVYMLGFQIGYPYMASLPPALRLPRLQRPRLKTPLGAVAIAGELTGIYSLPSPGGWRVLGTTPWPMYDLGWDPPTLLQAGDRVRFVAIDRARFDQLRLDPAIAPGIVRAAPPVTGAEASPASPAVRVINPGVLATVQDLGRPGHGRYGIGPGGAMDRFAVRVGNRLLGNREGDAALEVTGAGAVLEFLSDATFAWAGTAGPLTLDGRPVPGWTVLQARPGQRFAVGPPERGLRGYLCLAGGIAANPVLGSRSTNMAAGFGGPFGRACRPGDELAAYQTSTAPRREKADTGVVESVYGGLPPNDGTSRAAAPVTLRLVPGLQREMFGEGGIARLCEATYTIGAESNRMGYRLAGPPLAVPGGYDIISDGLVEGAVQVPGNGQPFLLMADHQTTGGYPKPGVVAAADIPLASQLSPGNTIRFRECDVSEAIAARLAIEHALGAACGALVDLDLRVGGRRYSVQVDVIE